MRNFIGMHFISRKRVAAHEPHSTRKPRLVRVVNWRSLENAVLSTGCIRWRHQTSLLFLEVWILASLENKVSASPSTEIMRIQGILPRCESEITRQIQVGMAVTVARQHRDFAIRELDIAGKPGILARAGLNLIAQALEDSKFFVRS